MTPTSHDCKQLGVKRHIPNALVIARLLMAAATIGVLATYRFPAINAWAIPVAIALFISAALTDFFDGFLARRWNAVSVFGRIMDPLADKILVLGTFVMLAGPGFAIGLGVPPVSGFTPWMVVIILARELLVTSLRGTCESRGIDFSAGLAGKAKMLSQSIAIPLILLVLLVAQQPTAFAAALSDARQAFLPLWAIRLVDITAWTTTAITALSALPYITRATTALRDVKAQP